jgi:AsmA protein
MLGFAAPAYQFDLNIDRLNVDRYVPPKDNKPAAGQSPAPQGKQAEQPIDFSPLKPLDLNGRIAIGSLQANNIKASDVRIDVKAKGGRLDVDPILAKLYEGGLKGSAAIDANRNLVAVKQTLSGISIGPLLKDAIQKDVLEGHGSVVLDVTTSGTTVTGFKRALNGNAQMDLKDGAIKGVDLAGALRNIKAKLGAGDAEQSGSTTEKTDFSELTASFTIKNGVAHNSDLNVKSPLVRVSGEGDVNIPESTLDYTVKASVVASTAGQGGKERSDLKGLTLPVRIYGPYAALQYKLQFSQMLSGTSKEALKDTAKQLLRDSAKGQLQELGKGLLGGKGDENKAPGAGAASPPAKKPEDEVKEKLKGLFR